MKKLVHVNGDSGRVYKLFLHKDPYTNLGWLISEECFNLMYSREPMGWDFDTDDLKAINCKFIYMRPKKAWMSDCLIWKE